MSIYDKSSLVLIPSGTKTGKVYSQKPVSGDGDFTFTRSSAATRVNADGNIEKENANFVLHSQDFSNGAWVKNSLINTSFTETDPNGGSTAFKAESSGNGYIYQDVATSSGSVYVWSFYAKSDTPTSVDIRVDASTEAISLTTEWQRFSKFFVAGSATTRLWMGAGFTWGSGEVAYMAFAQCNLGTIATDYIATTTTAVEGGITDNVPRLDYTDSSCPALLLEPQRTNELGNSEYLGGWTTSGVTLTSNYGTSPEGYTNSTRLQYVGSTGYIFLSTPILSGAETSSVYVKGTSGETIKFGRGGNVASGDMYTLTGQWQRLIFTRTDNTGGAFHISTYGGATARDIEVWGAQLELGSYATSYIPTYGSSVTRVLETCQVEDESALINSEQGALYFEGIAIDPSYANVMSFSDGTNSNRICLTLPQNATNINAFSSVGGSKIDNNILHDPSVNSKYAIVWNGNSFKVFVNGVKKVDNTMAGSFSANTLTDIRFDRGDGALNFGGFCKSYLSIASALTDQEAIDLTTI